MKKHQLKALAVVFGVLFCGCATQKHSILNEPATDAEIKESVLTVNRLRHQLYGEKLYPENLPCILPGHTNCPSYAPQP